MPLTQRSHVQISALPKMSSNEFFSIAPGPRKSAALAVDGFESPISYKIKNVETFIPEEKYS